MKTKIFLMIFACSLYSQIGLAKNSFKDQQSHRAVYLVPVSKASLIKYSYFTNVAVEIRQRGVNEIKIEYSLPLELTGVENKVELSGTKNSDGSVLLYGNDGSANCAPAEVLGRCEMKYKNLQFDHEARRQVIESISGGDVEEVAGRLLVAEEFEGLVKENPAAVLPSNIENPQGATLPGEIFRGGDS